MNTPNFDSFSKQKELATISYEWWKNKVEQLRKDGHIELATKMQGELNYMKIDLEHNSLQHVKTHARRLANLYMLLLYGRKD